MPEPDIATTVLARTPEGSEMNDQTGPSQPPDVAGDGFAPSYEDYGPEELLEQAQANAQAALIATVAFLTERGVPLEHWTAALAARFDVAWDEPEPWDADEFLDAMLVNLRSLGAIVVSSNLAPARAEAVTTGFPDPERCVQLDADVATVARFHNATAPIAAARGLRWSWSLEDPATARTRLVVVRDDLPDTQPAGRMRTRSWR